MILGDCVKFCSTTSKVHGEGKTLKMSEPPNNPQSTSNSSYKMNKNDQEIMKYSILYYMLYMINRKKSKILICTKIASLLHTYSRFMNAA